MDAGVENGVGGGGVAKKKRRPRQKNPYKGIRMRYGGKWVAEIYGPPRVWLGTYRTLVAVARAYDVALFYVRGPNAELNFPECLVGDGRHCRLTPNEIKNRAVEVGYRVDELQSGLHISSTKMSLNVIDHESDVYVTPDLSKYPSLDN